MSYGLLVHNNNGEVVIDDTYSSLHLLQQRTVTGVQLGSSSTYQFAANSSAAITFVNVPVGATVAGYYYSGYYVVATGTTSLTMIDCVFADYYTPPSSGYGMKILNASGQLTFTTDYSLVYVTGAYTVPIGGSVSTTDSWVAFPTRSLHSVYNGGPYLLLAAGVTRSSSSVYSDGSCPIGQGPGGINQVPIPILTKP